MWKARSSDVNGVRAYKLRLGLGVLVFEDEGDHFDEIVVKFVEGERLGAGALKGGDASDRRVGPPEQGPAGLESVMVSRPPSSLERTLIDLSAPRGWRTPTGTIRRGISRHSLAAYTLTGAALSCLSSSR